MRTIKILRFEDVKVGDTVTLRKDSTGAEARGAVNVLYDAGGDAWDVGVSGFGPTFRVPGLWTLTAHQPAPAPEWEPGTVGTATISTCETSGSTTLQHGMWFRRGDDEPLMFMTDFGSSWASHMVATFVPDDIEALRADLDVARTQVSDLTGRNAALEALVQEQKRGLQARDTWIEDQTADA